METVPKVTLFYVHLVPKAYSALYVGGQFAVAGAHTGNPYFSLGLGQLVVLMDLSWEKKRESRF
jgi:hypothetical protein